MLDAGRLAAGRTRNASPCRHAGGQRALERACPINPMEMRVTQHRITSFLFEGETVRVIERDGEPWFVTADICRTLGTTNVSQAIRQLDKDEKGICLTYTPGGNQEVLVVSESGLFTLILRCREAVKPGTLPHRFRRWVTGEVLPAIRRTGRFVTPDATRPPVSAGSVYPETVALRMVTVAQRAFGGRVAREVWFATGLPVVPAMRLPSPQAELFTLTAR